MSWTTSDPQPIYDDLAAMRDLFDFTKDRLGEEAARLISESILESTEAELDCDGIPFAPLSYGYDAWKSKVAPGKPIGELWGLMKSPEHMEGETVIQPHHIEHTYGKDAIARTEALKFQLGGLVTGTRQPQRHFWGFNWAGIFKLHRLFDTVFHKL